MLSYTLLVNREHPLEPDYIPDDLVYVDIPFHAPHDSPKRMLRRQAAKAVQELFHRSIEMKVNLIGISGYRSYQRQQQLHTGSSYVAPAGASEHQSGLALDVSCPAVSLELTEEFAHTPEGKFLHDYAPLYGFILRYPQGKEKITGYAYEPWHIRYVTKSLALYLSLTGMTLEEYHTI